MATQMYSRMMTNSGEKGAKMEKRAASILAKSRLFSGK